LYVNGQEGILVEYSDLPRRFTLVWLDSPYQYVMAGEFDSKTDLLKIAEVIKIEQQIRIKRLRAPQFAVPLLHIVI